ncbi:MAG: hypothetical protein HZY73_16165 [Micropruina sp.]|nr:MAG: hypothetical protein HZY73_16165 [Micropruina sp.]
MSTQQPEASDEAAEARRAAEEAAANPPAEAPDPERTAAQHGLSAETMERLDHSG